MILSDYALIRILNKSIDLLRAGMRTKVTVSTDRASNLPVGLLNTPNDTSPVGRTSYGAYQIIALETGPSLNPFGQ